MSKLAHNSGKRQHGFTLVELAVVLLIVGMLFGGILAVRQMIEQAKVKSLQKLVDDIRTAASVFYRSQGRLPGDVNGDGQIADTAAESGEFFDELVAQKLITGSLDQVRKNPFGGAVSVKYDTTWKDNYIQLDQVPNGVIMNLDAVRDDNKPDDGTIRYKAATPTSVYFLL
jgi:prepilin-type N-terminal cleavage/methylation domain-containing protein